MKLDFENSTRTLLQPVVLEKLKEYKHIIVFGAGLSGEWCVKMLRNYGIEPTCFCDNYSGKWGGGVKIGLKIDSFENTISKYPDAAICVASMWQEEIFNQIKLSSEDLLTRSYDILTSMAWETSNKTFESKELDYIKSHIDKLESVKNCFCDETSRKVFEGVLNYRLTRNNAYLKEIYSKPCCYIDKEVLQNFLPKITDGIMIDGGAFDGDTIQGWRDYIPNDTVLHIHSYEADEKSCDRLKDRIINLKNTNVVLHKKALWNVSEEKLFFSENALSGKIDEKGNAVISEAIDDCVFDKQVTFIKMDIEGAERFALEGARKTIEKDKPVLAICAYHLQDDLIVLTDFVKSLNMEYKMYLRHYMISAGDTILYCVPKRRVSRSM